MKERNERGESEEERELTCLGCSKGRASDGGTDQGSPPYSVRAPLPTPALPYPE